MADCGGLPQVVQVSPDLLILDIEHHIKHLRPCCYLHQCSSVHNVIWMCNPVYITSNLPTAWKVGRSLQILCTRNGIQWVFLSVYLSVWPFLTCECVFSEVSLICKAIWDSFLRKHAFVYLRFWDTGPFWLSIQHNTMTNGRLLLRKIRLRESVFVSFLFSFYRTQLTMTSHTPCVLISFPSKLETCTK